MWQGLGEPPLAAAPAFRVVDAVYGPPLSEVFRMSSLESCECLPNAYTSVLAIGSAHKLRPPAAPRASAACQIRGASQTGARPSWIFKQVSILYPSISMSLFNLATCTISNLTPPSSLLIVCLFFLTVFLETLHHL